MLIAFVLSGLANFPLPVLGTTYVVDDVAGPGVDFTTLQSAFDAVQPSDVVVVRAGWYPGAATLTRAVRVVGEDGALIAALITVRDTPPGSVTVLSGLLAGNGSFVLLVENCAGTVVAEGLQPRHILAVNSADVRIHRNVPFAQQSSLAGTGSRIETVDCSFRGSAGVDIWCSLLDPDGHSAAEITGGALHAARSSFLGGDGGDSDCVDPGLVEPAGTGGAGVKIASSGELLLSGLPQHTLAGGAGGITGGWTPHTEPSGRGLWVQAGCAAQLSGATVSSIAAQGTITSPALADPTLRLLEPAVPGGTATLRVVAPPGSSVRIAIGALPVVVPIGGIEEDVLVGRAPSVSLGTVPAQGVLGWNYAVPGTWPIGTTVFVQATLTYPGGEVRRTNSVVLVVR